MTTRYLCLSQIPHNGDAIRQGEAARYATNGLDMFSA